MHGPSTSELVAPSPNLTWCDYNERGLAYAAEGAWEDATTAFSGAAESIATESDVASHEALALVLNNLAQSCYRIGQTDEAIRHAQRACALRVALVGEDAISVARARTDLAVMLGSTGRSDEAMALIARAIAGIERSAGDEELQLSHVLENAARLAMAAAQPSTAEPYLLRLHALLAVHEQPTDRADVLLASVTQHRERARSAFGIPAATIAGLDFNLDLAPGLGTAAVSHTSQTRVAALPPVVSPAASVLGFDVQYGTPSEEDAASMITARPASTHIPTPPATPVGPSRETPYDAMLLVSSSPSAAVSNANSSSVRVEDKGRTEAPDLRHPQPAANPSAHDRRPRRPNLRWFS